MLVTAVWVCKVWTWRPVRLA